MITLTPSAISEVLRLSAKASALASLRISVVGGGCSGMSYKLGLDSEKPGDKIQVADDVTILVDAKSFLFLDGMEIDFTDGFDGEGFVFNNPKASRTCGCGSSFLAGSGSFS